MCLLSLPPGVVYWYMQKHVLEQVDFKNRARRPTVGSSIMPGSVERGSEPKRDLSALAVEILSHGKKRIICGVMLHCERSLTPRQSPKMRTNVPCTICGSFLPPAKANGIYERRPDEVKRTGQHRVFINL